MSPAYILTDKVKAKLMEGLYYHDGRQSGIANRLIAMERFETILGVYNHDIQRDKSLSPLSTHNEWSQDTKHSLANQEIKRLIEHRVPSKTGMSIVDLMNLPAETYRLVIRACANSDIKTGGEIEDLEGEISDMMQQNPPT